MSADADDLSRNAASTGRLRGLAARLGEADLRRPLGGGWTVAFALAHLAFWDARQDAAIRRWAASGGAFAREDAAVNEALEAIAALVDADAAAAAAVEAAARLDATVEGLGESRRGALREAGGGYAVGRWPHREEHAARIEAALG